MQIKPINLAQIAIIAKQAINAKKHRDFDFLLEDINEIIKLSCKTSWQEESKIYIDEMPF